MVIVWKKNKHITDHERGVMISQITGSTITKLIMKLKCEFLRQGASLKSCFQCKKANSV